MREGGTLTYTFFLAPIWGNSGAKIIAQWEIGTCAYGFSFSGLLIFLKIQKKLINIRILPPRRQGLPKEEISLGQKEKIMAANKIFRNGMVWLAVCLGLLVLPPGLAPANAAEYTAIVGGGSQMSWGQPAMNGPNAVSIADQFNVFDLLLGRRVGVMGEAKAGHGVVGVSAQQVIFLGNSLPTEANAIARASFTEFVADPNDPTIRTVPGSSFNFFIGGTLEEFPASTGEIGILFTASVNGTEVGRLQIINHGTGPVILADTFGVNAIFNPTTGQILGKVTVSCTLNFNDINSFVFSASLSSFAQFPGPGRLVGDFSHTFSFPTTGPVFLNLPPGVTVNGDGIVNNHYTNPFAAAAGTQSALRLLLLDD